MIHLLDVDCNTQLCVYSPGPVTSLSSQVLLTAWERLDLTHLHMYPSPKYVIMASPFRRLYSDCLCWMMEALCFQSVTEWGPGSRSTSHHMCQLPDDHALDVMAVSNAELPHEFFQFLYLPCHQPVGNGSHLLSVPLGGFFKPAAPASFGNLVQMQILSP